MKTEVYTDHIEETIEQLNECLFISGTLKETLNDYDGLLTGNEVSIKAQMAIEMILEELEQLFDVGDDSYALNFESITCHDSFRSDILQAHDLVNKLNKAVNALYQQLEH